MGANEIKQEVEYTRSLIRSTERGGASVCEVNYDLFRWSFEAPAFGFQNSSSCGMKTQTITPQYDRCKCQQFHQVR